jgi:4-hydroxy 2-oxovalerate aldolase
MKTKILDCTIRDGGYLNNWRYSKQMVKDLYRAVSKSGTDFIEIGFRSSDKYFDPSEMGVWRFTPEELVNEIAGEVAGSPIALMLDYGKADLEDIPLRSKSNVSLYRVAVNKTKALEAIEFSNAVADKGYLVSIQLMGIVGYTDEDFAKILPALKTSRLSIVYFADSYGSLLPSDIEKYIKILRGVNKPLGFHPHNNLQLAFANTLEAIKHGVDYVDATVYGMGRGSGNLPLETLITYCEKTIDENKYNVLPILELINKYFIDIARELSWGHNLPYMISGAYEVHPNYARALIESGRYSIEDMQSVLKLVRVMNPVGFDKSIITRIDKLGFFSSPGHDMQETVITGHTDDLPVCHTGGAAYKDRHDGRNLLILSNGTSLVLCRDKINRFIELYDPVVIGSNYLGGLFVPHYHSFNDRKRFSDFISFVHPDSKLLLSSTFPREFICEYTDRDYELIGHKEAQDVSFNIENGLIVSSSRAISVLSVATAIVMGAKNIFIAGMDGYKDAETFMSKGIGARPEPSDFHNDPMKISARSGEYKEQMAWHNSINNSLRDINEYLLSHNRNELIIITPTTHKAFYKDIDSFLLSAAR